MILCLNAQCRFELTVAHIHSPQFVERFEYMVNDEDGTAFCLCPICGAELESAQAPHYRPNTWLEREDPSQLPGLSLPEQSAAVEPPSVPRVSDDGPLVEAKEPDLGSYRLRRVGDDGYFEILAAEDNPFDGVVITTWRPGMQNALKAVKKPHGGRRDASTGSAVKTPAPASTPPTESVSAPASAPATLTWSDLV